MNITDLRDDPIKLARILWPGVVFYREQREIIESVWYDDETIVPAANMMGKDFVAGFIVVAFFLTRKPCRVITTSATDSHMDILWGEIERFLNNSRIPLLHGKGGTIISNHHQMRRYYDGEVDPFSFVKGIVTRPGKGESMQGGHAGDDPFTVLEKLAGDHKGPISDGIARTLFMCDEASGVEDKVFTMAKTWAHRMLVIGNTWPCENYFYRAVNGDVTTGDPGGDIVAESSV